MSSTDLRNQPFEWDQLYNLYKKDILISALNENIFKDKEACSIFANFIIAYSYEKGYSVIQDKEKALGMYEFNAFNLLDPLSCYRLAELHSIKSDFVIEPNFQYTWFYLLLFSSLIEPLYDIDFFKGTDWLVRIINQADPQLTNSFEFLRELINQDHEPLVEVIQNLLLIKLNVQNEKETNQQRYDRIVDKLISILKNEQTNQNSRLSQLAYNILLGLTFKNFNQVEDKQFIKILETFTSQIELTYQKAKELQIESVFSKYQIDDNFFSQRHRRTVQQLFWIRYNMNVKQEKEQNELNAYNDKSSQKYTKEQIERIKELDNILTQTIFNIYKNDTLKSVVDQIISRRIYARMLYNNNDFEKSFNIINEEIKISSQIKNTQAYAQYLISKIYAKLNQEEAAIEYGKIANEKIIKRISEENKESIILQQCYFLRGRLQERIYQDFDESLKYYVLGVRHLIDNYKQYQKETSFEFIIFQKKIIKKILKLTKSKEIVDQLINEAQLNKIQLYLPKLYFETSNIISDTNRKQSLPSPIQKQKSEIPLEIKSPSQASTLEISNHTSCFEIQIFGINYQLFQGDEYIDGISQRNSARQNISQINMSTNYNENMKQLQTEGNNFNIGASISSFQSIKQYSQNEKLNLDEQFLFELTKKYINNDCKMKQIDNKDLKMKSMIRKGDLGAVYGVRYNKEFYAAKVITYINQKQLQKFLDLQNKLPYCQNLLHILGYSTSNNKDGAINLYLISEIKSSNLQNFMQKSDLVKIEQKIKIIDQLISCVSTLHKNTNILLDSQFNIYISDLSVSRIFKDYEIGENSFKEPYAAPEQVLESDPENGKSCDMWAIGIIGLQLLTNIKSFTLETINSLNIYANGDFKIKLYQPCNIQEVNLLEKQMASFFESLLRFDPKKRINAQQAVEEFKQIKQTLESIKKLKL